MSALIKAKKKYKDIYFLQFDEKTSIVFRSLTWGEFKDYRSLLLNFPDMEMDLAEDIFKQCTVEFITPGIPFKKWATKKDMTKGYLTIEDVVNYIPAGVVDTVFKTIIHISGSFNIEQFQQDLSQARFIAVQDVEEQLLQYISTIFKIKKTDYNNMSWNEILMTIARAEKIIQGQVPEAPFTFKAVTNEIDFENENKDNI